MRCECCDNKLTDYETSLKHRVTGLYLNTCRKCLKSIGIIPWTGNKALIKKDIEEETLDELNFDFTEVEDE